MTTYYEIDYSWPMGSVGVDEAKPSPSGESFDTYEDAVAAIQQVVPTGLENPTWNPQGVEGCPDDWFVVFNESDDEGCGGFVIKEVQA